MGDSKATDHTEGGGSFLIEILRGISGGGGGGAKYFFFGAEIPTKFWTNSLAGLLR